MVAILGANSVSGGYEVSNSIRLNDGDNTFLSRTPSSTSNRQKFTFSCWSKGQSDNSSYHSLFTAGSDNPDTVIWFTPDEKIRSNTYDSGSIYALDTDAILRDPSAWYHIVVAYDTTQSTSSNRIKMYINGVEQTAFSGSYPSQNYNTKINDSSYVHRVGGHTSSAYAGDGYLCEVAFIDGSQLDATSFGEFNDDGVWIPKDFKNDVTFGTNGFLLEFKQTGTSQNSSGIGADTSGNDNHFAVSNLQAIDVTEDTCTNNFATLNPMIRNRYSNSKEPEEGNCAIRFTDTNGNIGKEFSTFGVNSGKWYWEVKVPVVARAYVGVGYMQEMIAFTNPYYDNNPSKGFALNYNGQLEYDSTSTSYGSSLSNNDIVQIALDMDNHLCWFGINGTWQNSATQSEIENSTASNDATTKMGTQQNLNSGEFVFAFVSDPSSSGMASFDVNFGNPTFSISSSNNDGLYGNFEYAVPSGYYALCTKRLGEFG